MERLTQWIDLGDVVLRCETAGSGPNTILLFHEMGGSLESWDDLVPLLEPRYRIVRFDTRNAGQSEKIAGPVTMETLSSDAVRLLDALGIEDPVVVMGCAVGAANALHFAGTHPQRTKAVVAVSPAMGVAPGARAALLERSISIEREGPRSIVDSSLTLGYPPELRGDERAFLQTRAQRIGAPPHGFAEIYRMFVDLDIAPSLETIEAPALLVGCRFDRNVPLETVRALQKSLVEANMMEIDAGHYAPVQTPSALADATIQFVDSR